MGIVHTSEPSFDIEIQIDRTPVIATIDSGCTGILISRNLIDRLSLDTYKGPRKCLEYADGKTVYEDTYATIPLQIGERTRDTELLVTDITADILLGLRWLRQENPKINWTTGKLQLGAKQLNTVATTRTRITPI